MKITLVTAEHRAAGAAFRGGGVSLGPCMKTGRQGVVEVRGCSRLPCTRERSLDEMETGKVFTRGWCG